MKNKIFLGVKGVKAIAFLFLSLLMISFNLFGNGLRDAFNPTTRGEDD